MDGKTDGNDCRTVAQIGRQLLMRYLCSVQQVDRACASATAPICGTQIDHGKTQCSDTYLRAYNVVFAVSIATTDLQVDRAVFREYAI
ncbi:hypothetical protein HO173_011257 [Letharia columbiana]|uniref:Uncharacterized protein n=1 Tax=Letharia columbiana TaxID=112416 RepID=A0A8H6FJV2_9LECA|nr:uncharacterized protein HO173_011257 [Letharia columbiana]KAF6229827.1 hypothetical protein HO173_011257 [Letharia columbiana]